MFFVIRSVFWLGMVFSAMDWPGNGQLGTDVREAATPIADKAAAAAAAQIQKTCTHAIRDCIEGAARINRLAGDLSDQQRAITQTAANKSPPMSIDTLLAADLEAEWSPPAKPVKSAKLQPDGKAAPGARTNAAAKASAK